MRDAFGVERAEVSKKMSDKQKVATGAGAAGDAGGALGAALTAYHIYFEKERTINYAYDSMNGSYLGNAISKEDINELKEKYKNETCEKCGSPMIIKVGRFGPFLACSA